MTLPTPENSSQTAYMAFALVSELIDLLARKSIITDAEIDSIYESLVPRLGQENNFDAEQASKFVADWMKRKP